MIQIALIEHHNIVRNEFKTLLSYENDMDVVAEAASGVDMLKLMDSHTQVDVILTDISLPEMDGISFCSKVSEKFPSVKVIILSMFDQVEYVSQAFKAGAWGYVLKDTSPDELTFAIKRVARGDRYLCSELALTLLERQLNMVDGTMPENTTIDFTKRELEILALVSEGYTNQEIAERLYTSKRTVEGHRQSLIEKTGARNSAALIKLAIMNGLIK